MLERLKQHHIILLITVLIYQILNHFGITIDIQIFQDTVDLVTFILFGYTVYKSDKDSLL